VERLLTLRETAELLQVNERTALRLAHAGELPAARIGGQWRVHPVELERWFLKRAQADENEAPGLFAADRILLDHPARTVEEVFDAAVDVLARTGRLIYTDAWHLALREREAMKSTGVGHGVAIPHARDAGEGLFREPVVVFLRLAEGVEWGAGDGRAVDLVFAAGAPGNATHLTNLAAVMRVARDEGRREALRAAPDEAAVLDILAARETLS